MAFRDKVKRVFNRSSNNNRRSKPKVEYYRRNAIPPSKFQGPFDPELQKRLAAWSFDAAMAHRPRSIDLDLSPCTSNPDYPSRAGSENPSEEAPSDDDGVPVDPALSPISESSQDSSPRPIDTGSQSSTVVNPESYSGSMMTLLPETSIYEIPEDPVAQLKESIRYTSPIVRTLTPQPKSPCMSPRPKHLPFSPEALTRALMAIQL